MNLEKLSQHLFDHHGIQFGEENDDPAEEWIEVADSWRRKGTPTPITSESENEVSEDDSKQEEEELTIVPQLHPSIIQERNSDISSESSSGNTSNSKSRKKSKSLRTA